MVDLRLGERGMCAVDRKAVEEEQPPRMRPVRVNLGQQGGGEKSKGDLQHRLKEETETGTQEGPGEKAVEFDVTG